MAAKLMNIHSTLIVDKRLFTVSKSTSSSCEFKAQSDRSIPNEMDNGGINDRTVSDYHKRIHVAMCFDLKIPSGHLNMSS